MLQGRLQVLDVRDRALVQLLEPALVDQQLRIPRIVRHHDDVFVDRLPTRQRALDLAEVRGVVVDVFDVVDRRAGLLLEHVEGRVLAPLHVVDVQRPVREPQCLGERLVAIRARGLGAAAATGRQHTGKGQERAARGCAPEQVAAGEDVGHWDASVESTTNVESGFQLSVSLSPGIAPFSPGDAFCLYTIKRPHAVSTMYCVATPTYACSTTVPSSALGWPLPSSIFSGRMPTATWPLRPASAWAGTRTSGPLSSRTVSEPLTVPVIRFETPRKLAT